MREPKPGAVHDAWTAVRSTPWTRSAALCVIAGGFLSASGAFGSGEAPWPLRTAYWIGLMLAGAPLAIGMNRLFARIPGLGFWTVFWSATLVMSAVYTAVVAIASRAVFGPWPPAAGKPLLVTLAWTFPTVLLVSLAMGGLHLLAGLRPRQTRAAAAGAPPPRFLQRLPPKLAGAELYAVQAQDHYLRLHTSRGTDLILMRLSDAMAELEGLEGAQTHRSWWVARSAVAEVRRSDGRAVLTLKDGASFPVSRTYARALRAAGWW
jgi:hypothetical protein